MFLNQALEVPTGSTSASSTNILDLNCYCLEAIFSVECLSAMDLCAVGETHFRLKEVVNEVFYKRHKNCGVHIRKNMENTKRVLSNFGGFISQLSISGLGFNLKENPECLDWMMKYCNDTLESLELSYVHITEDETIKLKPLFKRLQKISLKSCHAYSGNKIKFEQANTNRILSNFGVLSISPRWPACLHWMMEYCSGALESLKALYSKLIEAQTIKLKPFLDGLRKICLKSFGVYSGKILFSQCESLVELELEYVKFDDQQLALVNTFPKLSRFEYEYWGTTDFIGDSIWRDFFSRHKNLKAVKLRRNERTSHLLPMVAYNCKQLAELEIYFQIDEDEVEFEMALGSILTLDNLNKLNIQCDGQNITKFIQRLKDLKLLQFLTLQWVDCDSEFVRSLSKLTKLQSLELIDCRGIANLNPLADLERLTELKIESQGRIDIDIVSIIKRLIKLKFLQLDVLSFQMDNQIYHQIVDVLQQRPDRFQDTLRILCFTADDYIADLQFQKILIITDIWHWYDSDSD